MMWFVVLSINILPLGTLKKERKKRQQRISQTNGFMSWEIKCVFNRYIKKCQNYGR